MHKFKYDIEKETGIPWKKKKSYRYLYTLACQKGVILRAFKRMKRGKSDRKDIQMVEEDLDGWVEKIQKIIQNTKPAGWKVENPELEFKPPKHNPVIIKEAGKTRVIYVPTMVELWIQHVIVLILEPIIQGSSYHHSYSSFPKRGSHRGMKAMKRWIQSGKGIRNFAQCDIRHFYDHAKYKFIRPKLLKRIKDALFMYLIDVCLTWFPDKLPLGFYLSQWLANFLLQELDFLIKCKLKIAHFIRYMDNFTMADDNKKKLHMAIIFIKQWLGKIRLKMKGDWQVFRFEYIKKNGRRTGREVSAMGWLFYRNRVIIRKHTLIHIARIARKLNKKKMEKKKYPLRLCKGFISLMGWITHSDTYEWYLMYIKPLGRVRTDYLHKAQKYVETAMQSAQYTIDNATSASEKSKATKAVAILKESKNEIGASIIAIEEPESHLHPEAIHSLVNVINGISENHQVIITTHNPLFVQRNNISNNIIVDHGTAKPAKNIKEIRELLGVLPEDNLINASHVLVVEGEDDKIALNKILSSLSPTIKDALIKNKLVIQPLAGATNLNYELSRLRSYVCRYFVFLDADEAGYDAAEKAIEKGLLSESDVKYSICNGNNTAEFEDCLKKDFYIEAIRNKFSVDLGVTSFRNSKKWSDRVKTVFLSQGQRWTDAVEKKVKMEVTKLIPVEDADSVLDEHKRGSIDALVNALENMLSQR